MDNINPSELANSIRRILVVWLLTFRTILACIKLKLCDVYTWNNNVLMRDLSLGNAQIQTIVQSMSHEGKSACLLVRARGYENHMSYTFRSTKETLSNFLIQLTMDELKMAIMRSKSIAANGREVQTSQVKAKEKIASHWCLIWSELSLLRLDPMRKTNVALMHIFYAVFEQKDRRQ